MSYGLRMKQILGVDRSINYSLSELNKYLLESNCCLKFSNRY